jgi:hypothetical protein
MTATTSKVDFTKAAELQNIVLMMCENKRIVDDDTYRAIRISFLLDPTTKTLVPDFLQSSFDLNALWHYLKSISAQWAPRRDHVRSKFIPLLSHLEFNATVVQTNDQTMISNTLYNLFVSYNVDEWNGMPWLVDASRCISANEYTNPELVEKFSALDENAINFLKSYPCLFCYESVHKKDPAFGYITSVIKRQGKVRVEYEIIQREDFLTYASLERLKFELDISPLELNRTHWAIKKVNLFDELSKCDIKLISNNDSIVDITKHIFPVSLSFPGEARLLVSQIAKRINDALGKNSCFYDDNYKAQLARPSLDVILQNIYREQSDLIVVFLGENYQEKRWCGIEFRAIKEIISNRDDKRVMFIRMDDGKVDGVFVTDGYIDARQHNSDEIVDFIIERLKLL